MLQRTSRAVRLIRRLPHKSFALRLWSGVERLRGPAVVRTAFGAKMHCDPNDIVGATILHFGVWDPEITEIAKSIVRPGDIAVDVGASVGYYSLLFSKLGAQPVAIEPVPRLAHEIEENDRLNRFNIRIETVAATGHKETVQLHQPPRANFGTGASKRGRFADSITVAAAPLLDILKGVDLKRVSLIKIDIDGAEAPVMREIASNLARFGDRLAICVAVGSRWNDAFEALVAAGFGAWRVPTNLETLWARLLADEPSGKPVRIDAFPAEACDLVMMREALL